MWCQVSETKCVQIMPWWEAVIYHEQVVLSKRWCGRRWWCLWGERWFRISVGAMRIGIQRGTGRALRTLSVERQVDAEPTSWDAGRKPPNHTCCVHTHTHARTYHGSHWSRIISSNQYQFMSFKTKVPSLTPPEVLFRVNGSFCQMRSHKNWQKLMYEDSKSFESTSILKTARHF